MAKFISYEKRNEVDKLIKEYELPETKYSSDNKTTKKEPYNFSNETITNARETGDKLSKILEKAYSSVGKDVNTSNEKNTDRTR